MEGVITDLCTKPNQDRFTYGFIQGDDGVRYFFFGGGMQWTSPTKFEDLGAGMRVKFTVLGHPNGPRAIEVATFE